MSSESLEDQVSRLRAICNGGPVTWAMCQEDIDAIALAVRVLSVIQAADDDDHPVTAYGDESGLNVLQIGDSRFAAQSMIECFSAAGRSLE